MWVCTGRPGGDATTRLVADCPAVLPTAVKVTNRLVLAPGARGPTFAQFRIPSSMLSTVGGVAPTNDRILVEYRSSTGTVTSVTLPVLATVIWNTTDWPTSAAPFVGLDTVLVML